MNLFPAFAVGFSSLIFQTAVMRRFLALFSGNELIVGIVLAVWLAAVGLGSLAGRRLKNQKFFAILFALTAVLGHATVLMIPSGKTFFSIGLGETASLGVVILSAVLFLSPLCFLTGMLYPLMVRRFGGRAAEVYAWEAAGACCGGLFFALLLAGRVSTPVAASGTAVVLLAAGAVSSREYRLLFALAVPIMLQVYFGSAERASNASAGELIQLVESKYGEISLYRARGQVNVFASGQFDFSYPDPQTEEVQAHLPLSLHPGAGRVLVIGGSPAVVREVLKYPAEYIDYVDLDPAMKRITGEIMHDTDQRALQDRRVRLIASDARLFIQKQAGAGYDLILLNLPAPLTANLNRFYTAEYFQEAKKAMQHGGILVLRFPSAHGYVGRRMQVAAGSVFSSLSSVFAFVAVSSEEYGICAASDAQIDTRPDVLTKRFAGRSVQTSFFGPYLFEDAFSAPRVASAFERLQAGGRIASLNTDSRPVAYLYHLLLWAESQRAGWLLTLLDHGKIAVIALAAAYAAAALLFRRKRSAVYFTTWSTGFGTMGFSVALLLSYQASFGLLYEKIGLLSALFMAGMACGAFAGRRGPHALAMLRWTGTGMALFLASVHVFFTVETYYFLCATAAGMLAAAEFSAANRFLVKDDAANTAGKLYAVDLAGSFLGALLAAVFLVPVLGIPNALLFMACLKAMPTAVLFSLGHDEA